MKTNADIQINSDMGLVVIQAYLEELGDKGSTEPYSGLASACSIVLDGKGAELKCLCVATIA